MKINWITDPKDSNPSVSLTLLLISLVLVIGFGTAQVLNKVQTMGPFTELFYSAVALYFGRRLNIGGKGFSSDTATSVITTISNTESESK